MKKIDELLGLPVNSQTTCADVRPKAKTKISEMEEKIRDLERTKKALQKLAASCRGRGPTKDCATLDYLETE